MASERGRGRSLTHPFSLSPGHRHARLQELLLEELRGLLRDDVTDPSLAEVVVRAVVLSADYRHARVHFSLPPTHETEEASARAAAERGFSRATAFLRARLADALDLKRVPELRFVFDGPAVG
jgi:ribosome-binding factor A